MTCSGGKKYIGRITSDAPAGDLVDVMTDHIPVKLEEAFALIEMDLPMQTPQGGIIQHVAHCRPIDNCEGPSTIRIVPHVVHLFDDMSPGDRRRHKGLVEQVADSAMKQRAERSGLALVKPGGPMPRIPGMPNGPGPGRPPGL